MKKERKKLGKLVSFSVLLLGFILSLSGITRTKEVEAGQTHVSHLGTFNGTTIFTTHSENGVNPGLWLEVMDDNGNVHQYESDEGKIILPDTQEGAYVTQARLLGKSKFKDQETGELLDAWEEGRKLELVSVENPSLTIKNKFTANDLVFVSKNQEKSSYHVDGTTIDFTFANRWGRFIFNFDYTKGKEYLISFNSNEGVTLDFNVDLWERVSHPGGVFSHKFTPKNETPIQLCSPAGMPYTLTDFMISAVDESHYPYQVATVKMDEDIQLRGVGKIQDTFDLITGEQVQKVGEWHLTATEKSWRHNQDYTPSTGYSGFNFTIKEVFSEELMPKFFPNRIATLGFGKWAGHTSANRGTDFHTNGNGKLVIESSIVSPKDLEGLKVWLAENKVVMHYELANPNSNVTPMVSTYQFPKPKKQHIQLTGTIEPLLVSITVPSESLDFVLDPNQEKDRQFIAPELVLRNETYAPLQVELRTFEQVTDVLVDVLPDKYEDWDNLNRRQSEHMALSLNPLFSDQWLTLNEVPYYVANTSNAKVGTLKGNSEVAFEFKALHGQSFAEVLQPTYRIVFVFDYLT